MNRFKFIIIPAILLFSCSKQSKDSRATASGQSSPLLITNTIAANGSVRFSNDTFYEAAALQSAARTFGKCSTATIKKIDISNFPEGSINTVFYTTEKGIESTFVVIENNTLSQRVTVDCYGTCDCRERLILDASGNPRSYECTCDKCKMDVITTTN